MRIGFDTRPFSPTVIPNFSTCRGALVPNGGGFNFIPDDWSAVPRTGGDPPVNGKSFLSVQSDGTLQSRNNAGPWETFYINGLVATVNPEDSLGSRSTGSKTYAFAIAQVG